MPIVPVKTSSGVVNFNCTISTPTKTEAERIEPGLPTILFMHGVYLPQIAFHSQFVDPLLRKFNLVTFDFRSHGETTGAKVPLGYGQKDVAHDVIGLMNALRINSCHIMALSMGTVAALEIASRWPERCLSLLLVAPLGLQERDELKSAHEDIHDLWRQGYPEPGTVLEDVLKDAFYGCMQLAFSGKQSEMADACLAIAFVFAESHWGPDNFDEFKHSTLDLFNNRKSLPKSQLSRIRCPVRIFRGDLDLAHPLEYTEQFVELLHEAGCTDFEVTCVPNAPHLVSIDNPKFTNPVLHDLVMQQVQGTIPDVPDSVFSPWTPILRDAGWIPEGDDEDEDGFVMHYQGFSSNVVVA
ncbi:hypothetical protein D9758_006371 [Tetrapyrgos nigripes]|uniref:AB hydrolase-1 domain-containing protein n=1 Tax=Tetrapyrgos nigripes TaxID=182062 RepID=A0A8H5D8G7_9AGAR|nr:hypothetical protein D9758_006371 [Tetrapyrgos nigripes]